MSEQKTDIRMVQLEAYRDEVCSRITEVENELKDLIARADRLTETIIRRTKGEDC